MAALGTSGFTALQVMQVVGERAVRIVPDVSVTGNGDGGGLLLPAACASYFFGSPW